MSPLDPTNRNEQLTRHLLGLADEALHVVEKPELLGGSPQMLEALRQRAERAMRCLQMDRKWIHRGITYHDFPGSDNMEKRMNFSMFRRGAHPFNVHCGELEGRPLREKLEQLSAKNRENGSKHKGTKRKDPWGE